MPPPETTPSKSLSKDISLVVSPNFYKEDWLSGGKWLLFTHDHLPNLDNYRQDLKALVEVGTLSALKSSQEAGSQESVLMCFTKSSEDRAEVKKAADAIREVTSETRIFYYKTNEASDTGKYSYLGRKVVSKYMHTVAGSLYEQDELHRWKKIV